MKTIKGDLILKKDTVFEESIKVEGNIRGKDGKRFNLKVEGDITAGNIHVWDIDAWDIHAWDIDTRGRCVICKRQIYFTNVKRRNEK